MLSNNKPEAALVALQEVEPERWMKKAKKVVAINRAQALAASGEIQESYDSLIEYYTTSPADDLKSTIMGYGKKLGKDNITVASDIWMFLDGKAIPATVFNLNDYTEPGNTVSLNDYKGRVLLITYWFPGCGPCRREFPHFENVLKKYSKDQVAYVGINMVPEQDDYVLPFLKSSGYSFKPLRDDPDNRGNLTARGPLQII